MLTLDIGLLAGVCGLLGSLGAVAALIYRLLSRFAALEKQTRENRGDIRVMYKALFACLDGLRQLGCNGEVNRALKDMKNKLIDE